MKLENTTPQVVRNCTKLGFHRDPQWPRGLYVKIADSETGEGFQRSWVFRFVHKHDSGKKDSKGRAIYIARAHCMGLGSVRDVDMKPAKELASAARTLV